MALPERPPERIPYPDKIIDDLLSPDWERKVQGVKFFHLLHKPLLPVWSRLTRQGFRERPPNEEFFKPGMTEAEREYKFTTVGWPEARRLGKAIAEIQLAKRNFSSLPEGMGENIYDATHDENKTMLKLAALNITIADEDVAKLAAVVYKEGHLYIARAVLRGYYEEHARNIIQGMRDESEKAFQLVAEKKRHVLNLFEILIGKGLGETDRPDSAGPPPPDGGDREPRRPSDSPLSVAAAREEPKALSSVTEVVMAEVK